MTTIMHIYVFRGKQIFKFCPPNKISQIFTCPVVN